MIKEKTKSNMRLEAMEMDINEKLTEITGKKRKVTTSPNTKQKRSKKEDNMDCKELEIDSEEQMNEVRLYPIQFTLTKVQD